MRDTIFALGSGPAPAGVAVIRLSGPASAGALAAVIGSDGLPAPRRAALRRLRDPDSQEVLDDGLVLWFPGPASFTGEDMAELHVHGGAATISAVQATLSRLPSLRPAERGEFARRAFANGRLDLTEVEGLADLVAAETEAQRRLAMRQAGGEGRSRYEVWTESLVRILAMLEAAVDFPEDDLPKSILSRNEIDMKRLVVEWAHHIEIGAATSSIREGVRIAILGASNVGKSSLLNSLAGRDAAIVSETAGTTRDVVEVRLDLNGYMVTLSDTAGLRPTDDHIEEEGVRRALVTAESADLILLLSDDVSSLETLVPKALSGRTDDIVTLLTKSDLVAPPAGWPDVSARQFAVSAKTGDGLGLLLATLGEYCVARYGRSADAVAVRARHREALSRARDALERALDQTELALAGEDIRLALAEMGRITGRVDVEVVLDVVFSEFCIGK